MKHIFAAVLSMLCAFVSAAPQLPASLKTEPDGTFTFNGIAFEITVSDGSRLRIRTGRRETGNPAKRAWISADLFCRKPEAVAAKLPKL